MLKIYNELFFVKLKKYSFDKLFFKNILLNLNHYCPINFYYSNIIGISHFVRNDNQLFIFGVGVRKRLRRFLTPTPTKIHLMTCHSERSDESTYFCRTLVNLNIYLHASCIYLVYVCICHICKLHVPNICLYMLYMQTTCT